MKMLTMITALALAGTAHAQQPQPAGVTRHNNASAPVTVTPAWPYTPRPAVVAPTVARVLTGGLGFVGGAVLGIGAAQLGGPYHCSCDDPGLDQAVTGALIGGVVGAGLGAALPSFASSCSLAARIGRGIAGSALGFGLGLVAPPFGPLILSPIGSGIALAGC